MLWSAFILGFLGSFHCAGMCGPLALAKPNKTLAATFLYNIGRAITYSMFGLVVGIIGTGASWAGMQQAFSIGIGIFMLVVILFTKYRSFEFPTSSVLYKLYKPVKREIGKMMLKNSWPASIGFGLVNGLLPCGLVYAALFVASTQASLYGSSLYMLAFGVGTFPMMLSVVYFGNYISSNFRLRLNKMVPVFLGLVAVLLIFRGLNLGIPYVSPMLVQSEMVENDSIPLCNE